MFALLSEFVFYCLHKQKFCTITLAHTHTLSSVCVCVYFLTNPNKLFLAEPSPSSQRAIVITVALLEARDPAPHSAYCMRHATSCMLLSGMVQVPLRRICSHYMGRHLM